VKSTSPNHNGDTTGEEEPSHVAIDTNLIQLEPDEMATTTNTYADNDDDLIFEDFARLRLKGETEA
jgi:beta-arrestin